MCEIGKVRSDLFRVLGVKRMFLSLCGFNALQETSIRGCMPTSKCPPLHG